MMPKHFETSAIRDNVRMTQEHEHSAAIFMTSSFLFDSAEDGRKLFSEEMEGNTYSRYTNPNVDSFASRLASLEGAEAGIGVASGMAAIFAAFGGLCQAGDHIVSCRQLFGSTSNLLLKVLPEIRNYFDFCRLLQAGFLGSCFYTEYQNIFCRNALQSVNGTG